MSDDLVSTLTGLAKRNRDDRRFAPRLYDAASEEDRRLLAELLRDGEVRLVFDELKVQLAGLMETQNPESKFTEKQLLKKVEEHLGGVSPDHYGNWAFFPWSQRLVHILPEAEFRELRTSRNRNKITHGEQEVLRGLRIGVCGLSIGHAAATTLAMEEIGGSFYLADFDRLELSNMNRIRSGLHSLGVNKAVIAARDIFEMNPYARVTIFTEGVTEKNLDDFLRPDKRPLDMVFEECDELHTKIMLRERARVLRIPVLMETSDRGLMDIERYDREPDRPIFHGLIGDVKAADLRGLSTFEKVPIVLQILNQDGITDRMAASMVDIETTLASWPQLASEVALGSALNTDVARRVALGQLTESGRYYVDIEKIISDGKGLTTDTSRSYAIEILPEALRVDLPPITPVNGAIEDEHIRTLVAYGSMGFSGGNCQPWRFVYRDGVLQCIHDEERSRSFLDCQNRASYLGFGSVVENIDLTARAMGLDAVVTAFPEPARPELVATVRFERTGGDLAMDELVHQIGSRVTNRRLGDRVAIPSFTLEALSQSAAEGGGTMQWLVKADELSAIADILSSADLIRMTTKITHSEMMHELRWNAEEVKRTRDGLDVATLEMSASDLAGLRLISSWSIMKVTDAIGGGLGLKRPMRKSIEAASAVGLLTVPGLSPTSFFQAGRALQRLWLQATAQGIAFQPVTPITYIFYRLERDTDSHGLSRRQVKKLADLRKRYRELFDVPEDHAEPMLFRVARAGPPTARSLRRHVEDILTIEK